MDGVPVAHYFFAYFDMFFIAVSSLKISQIGNHSSIKFAFVAMNINNSSMKIAISFLIAYILCELKSENVPKPVRFS